jgi:transcriptional regulator with XRE-family HTH domain
MVGKGTGELRERFGITVRRLRLAAGLSQEALAFAAGVERNFVSRIETGSSQPTITTIERLAKALDMRASELVAAAEQPTRRN